MLSEHGPRLLRSSLLWLGMLSLLLACQLPQPPGEPSEAPLVSPLVGASPLGEPSPEGAVSPLPTPDGGDGGVTWIPFIGGSGTGEQPVRSTWALVGLAAVGGLLFVGTAAAVFLLIRGWPRRRRERRAEPRPVPAGPSAGTADAATLTEGTMLNEGRYLVLDAQTDEAGLNHYEVKPTVAMDLCPTCYSPVAADGGDTCKRCGRPLPDSRPEHPILLAREVDDAALFSILSDLVKHRLEHPAVITPLATFTESSFGPARDFVVVPNVSKRLSEHSVEEASLEKVLSWGARLGEGLAALHERDLVLSPLSPSLVQVEGRDARWLAFDDLSSVADLAEDRVRERVAANVRELGALLVATATGMAAGPADRSTKDGRASLLNAAGKLPNPAGRVLSQVLKSTGRLHAADLSVALARAREELLATQGVRHQIASHSDVGRIRKLNEDSHLVVDLAVALEDRASALSIVAVADGVGGHDAGDVASQITVSTLQREADALKADLAAGKPLQAQAWIEQAALAANADLLSERQAMDSDMGATLVMVLLEGTRATVLNVGDSRAYRLGPSGIQQVTKDHSLVQRLVDIGQLTPEEARHHPQKSVIYRVMGDTPQLGYDLYELEVAPGEALLLCSDGLSDLVEDRVLWQVWREVPELSDVCTHLVDLANEAGGHDNITVAIVQVQS